MKNNIAIVGTRGIPAKYGGFETFAEEVSPILALNNFVVTVYCDNSKEKRPITEYKGVHIRYQKTKKSKHSLLFYLEGIFYALKENDIILVTGTAGSFFYFLNFFFKKKIITNTDGVESRRAKWSFFKQRLIKLSEMLAVKLSDHLIADSKGISLHLIENYPKLQQDKLSTIEYGAPVNNIFFPDYLKKHHLKKENYFLVVSRLEPENNLQMIIEGYKLANSDKELIIVGNCHENSYANHLLKYQSKKIRFVGGIYNKEELCTLRKGAFAYLHGHSVGGTNPSLLEAMGSSNICICHDNIFNREVTNENQLYFSTPEELMIRINELEKMDINSILKLKKLAKERIENYYNWENITNKYSTLFNKI